METLSCAAKLLVAADGFSIAINMWMSLISLILLAGFWLFTYILITRSEARKLRSKYELYFVSILTALFTMSIYQPLMVIYINCIIHSRYPSSEIDYSLICTNNGYNKLDQLATILFAIMGVDGTLVYAFLIGCYIQRLILIFKDSMFEVSNKVKISYIIYIIIAIACCGCIIYLNIIKKFSLQILIVTIIFLSFFIESMYVCYILVNKLTNVIKFINIQSLKIPNINNTLNVKSDTDHESYSSETRISAATNTAMQKQQISNKVLPLFIQTRKLTILTFATLTTSFLNAIISIMLGEPGTIIQSNTIRLMVIQFVYSLDTLINFACLTLQFKFSQKIYDKTFKIFETLPVFKKLESSLKC